MTRSRDPREAGWDAQRRRKFTIGLSATPAQRLDWLEEMISLAYASGALPRRRLTAEPPDEPAGKSSR